MSLKICEFKRMKNILRITSGWWQDCRSKSFTPHLEIVTPSFKMLNLFFEFFWIEPNKLFPPTSCLYAMLSQAKHILPVASYLTERQSQHLQLHLKAAGTFPGGKSYSLALNEQKNCTSTLTPTSSLFPFFLGCYVLQFLLCATVTLGPVHTLISTPQKNHNPFSSHFNETSPAVPTQAEPTHLCPKYNLVMTIVTLWFVDHHSSLKFCIIAILSFLAPEMTIFGPEGGACDTIYFI